MLKLSYKEVKDFNILGSIEALKADRLPFRFNYWLLKIYRKLGKEVKEVEQQLRDVLLDFIEKDADGKPVPQAEEKNAEGLVVKPARDWRYREGGEEEHRKAFQLKAAESLKIEFVFPEIEPLELAQLENASIPLEQLAGIEALSKEYQDEREADLKKAAEPAAT